MSAYDDERGSRRGRDDRPAPPYPASSAYDIGNDGGGGYGRRPRHTTGSHFGSNAPQPHSPRGEKLPPPPMGDAVRRRPSAMKREGSRSRVPHLRPEFPDEASSAPDLERKNRDSHRNFREKRDGYESEEGEILRKAKPRTMPSSYDDPEPRSRRPGGKDYYDDRRRDSYDDEPPRRSRRSDRDRDGYDDETRRPRRSGKGDVEYGSAPIPARRGYSEEPPRYRRSRKDDDILSSDEENRRRPSRRHDDADRRRRRERDDDYYDSDPRDRRRETDRRGGGGADRDRRRGERDRSRRRYSDDYDDRYDRRDGRDRSRRRRGDSPPEKIMIGKYDVGPWVEKGQKHYKTFAPILTPLVLGAARKYMSGGGKK